MSVIFGPVPSRRLGYSLGVDVVPPDKKICAFDCVYCQVGRTKKQTIKRSEPISTAMILKEIDRELPKKNIHFVTFSGSGEPTLHKQLGRFIDRIHERCNTPVAVITNSALVDRPDVQRDLLKADLLVPSLDAATQKTFEKINRPHPSLQVENIIKGLTSLKQNFKGDFWLEVMFVKGINDGVEELLKLKEVIERIGPDRIHVNTVTRPPAETWAKAMDFPELDRIAAMFGPHAQVIGISPKRDGRGETFDMKQLEEEV
ncbi:MAG: radical SAM protein, partial [Alphaproteobacteria bacterium]